MTGTKLHSARGQIAICLQACILGSVLALFALAGAAYADDSVVAVQSSLPAEQETASLTSDTSSASVTSQVVDTDSSASASASASTSASTSTSTSTSASGQIGTDSSTSDTDSQAAASKPQPDSGVSSSSSHDSESTVSQLAQLVTASPSQSTCGSASETENGWQASGSGWRYYVAGEYVKSQWEVLSDQNPLSSNPTGLQRYWLDADGNLAVSRLIDPFKNVKDAAAGQYSYATSLGYVVRGVYVTSDGIVYQANNDGVLVNGDAVDGSGWIVTDAFGDGVQRYYVDPTSHGFNTGSVESVAGYGSIYGVSGKGYVLRGLGFDSSGARLFADNDGRLTTSAWVVTDSFGQDMQRYWFGADSRCAFGRLVGADSAELSLCGYWAYACPEGYIVRGKYAVDGIVYLADNDGRLASVGTDDGWLVTDAYDAGLQRYWILAAAHAAKTGFFSVDGSSYLGVAAEGYVLRGTLGSMQVADNDGRLLTGSDGWLVTDGFGQGLQRYWLQSGVPVSSQILDAGNGWYAYATSGGYVVRGKLTLADGTVYLADNDGRLETTEGWLVTAAYDGGLQRYWIDESKHAAKTGYFTVGSAGYYGLPNVGYVARGVVADSDGYVYLADNDGVLASAGTGDGWVVSSAYGQGLQRYWIVSAHHAAQTGFFDVASVAYYGITDKGYVVRGKYAYDSDGMLLADNDGVLETIEGWLVTGKYDGGLQRYRMDLCCDGHIGALIGLFTVEGKSYYGRNDQGYVVRGVYVDGSGKFWIADNEGHLADICNFLNLMNNSPYSNDFQYFNDDLGFNMSGNTWDSLMAALSNYWNAGYTVSLVMMDLVSGLGCSYNDIQTRYAASCMKAAYLTYICQMLLDTGSVDLNDISWEMEQTGVWSNNDTYYTLRNMYGDDGFNAWLESSGIYGYGYDYYPFITARDLARIWCKIGTYQFSGAANSGWCRDILSHGYYSEIHDTFGSFYTTYTKAGWTFDGGEYDAFNDSGIIIGDNDRPYLVTVMTSSDCDADGWMFSQLLWALNSIHDEMPL